VANILFKNLQNNKDKLMTLNCFVCILVIYFIRK
jgi:hypothetical protein